MSTEPSEQLIQSLRNPAVWPHAVDDVELIETHISWVLLAGEFAYKIKKPVDLGFADFSTLERRRRFCEEELRLNGRLAPEIYLDVITIAGTAENPAIGGAGEPIEYAVKMRRFPQDGLLSRLIRRGELEARHIDDLAREVADFHARIDVAGEKNPEYGSPQSVFAPVEENFRHLRSAAGLSDAMSAQIEELANWSRREFEARREVFQRRRDDRFVRECHGDMHLGNMILQDDRVVIFDCIEFNESLRWIDVMSEAAFLVMDLEDRGRRDLGWRFLNSYLERTGDYAGLAVLRFYLVYRALVRAKVASIRLHQEDAGEEERESLCREFEQYVQLAVGYTQPEPPLLMITHGFAGSGKSTGMQPVVERQGALRIRSDVERQRMFAGDKDRYSAESTAATYERLAELAAAALGSGYAAIADATFLKRAQRGRFRSLATELGVKFCIVHFEADVPELRRRIAQRMQSGGDASEANPAVLDLQMQSHEPLEADELPFVVAVDDSENGTARLLERIGERAR